jgi:ABC-type proline/glycine betaine transport system substrate-binding protein
MPILTLDLSDAEVEKLTQLAHGRGKSPEACIKDFIAACQPGGSGWLNPEVANKSKPLVPKEKS